MLGGLRARPNEIKAWSRRRHYCQSFVCEITINYYLRRKGGNLFTFVGLSVTLWIGTRAAINSITPTTAFLTRHLPVMSRTGRTEYQLLLMKASDWGRNVNFRWINLVVFDELSSTIVFWHNESVHRNNGLHFHIDPDCDPDTKIGRSNLFLKFLDHL